MVSKNGRLDVNGIGGREGGRDQSLLTHSAGSVCLFSCVLFIDEPTVCKITEEKVTHKVMLMTEGEETCHLTNYNCWSSHNFVIVICESVFCHPNILYLLMAELLYYDTRMNATCSNREINTIQRSCPIIPFCNALTRYPDCSKTEY